MRTPKRPGNGAGDNYAVGYGKPPRHSRFQPGASGNPWGRPKGRRNFESAVRAALKEPVKVTQDGVARKVSTQEAVIMRLKAKALSGDAHALDRLIHLAQMYSIDEPTTASTLSADDEAILNIYRQRVLSGAADSKDRRHEQEETPGGG